MAAGNAAPSWPVFGGRYLHRYGSPLTLARPVGVRPPPPPPEPPLGFPAALLAGGWGASAVLVAAAAASTAAPAAWVESAAAIFGLSPLLFAAGIWAGSRSVPNARAVGTPAPERASVRWPLRRSGRARAPAPAARLPIPAPRPPAVPSLARARPARAGRSASSVAAAPEPMSRVTPAVRPPQFQMLVRMLDDIDRIEREVLGADATAISPSLAAGGGPGGCVECAIPFTADDDIIARCRTCESLLCPECATDAAHEGHPGACSPCWLLERGFEGLSEPTAIVRAALEPIPPRSVGALARVGRSTPLDGDPIGPRTLALALPPPERASAPLPG